MPEKFRVPTVLIGHFFRRFFDNDSIQIEGDTLTTVVRAVVAVAAPGLMYSFFLQPAYAPPGRAPWSAVQDQYFFVVFSFVVMGAVAIFEWDALFPDRLDFLILSPLSLKPSQLLGAKAAALVSFLVLFLFGCNVCAAIILSAIGGHLLRQLYAHWAAVLMAGAFASLSFLAIGGFLLCMLPSSWFRRISPLLRIFSITALVLLVLHCVKYGNGLQTILSQPLGAARWLPPFWFLGLYQQLLHGNAAPPFARAMAHDAIRATAIAFVCVIGTYPAAWARMRRAAIEGAGQTAHQPSQWSARLLGPVLRRPAQRAVFHFIGPTIARNHRYQLYLAMYGGTGLALAIACAVSLDARGTTLVPRLSVTGLHAAMPLLLFWIIAGLRTAFALPLNLPAGWVFRVTGVDLRECASAARRWVFLCALSAIAVIAFALQLAGWDGRRILVQVALGLCLAILLIDAFFFQQHVPFNRPRMPGRTNFPLMLTLYVGVFPLFILGVIHLAIEFEKNLPRLLFLVVATAFIHAGVTVLYRAVGGAEEEPEGYEGEFQVLGLSALQ